MKRGIQQVLVLLAWFVNIVLGFWVMIAYRQTLLSTLAAWYVGDSMPRAWRARFYDRVYFVIAGLIYLILIFVIDGYLRDGLKIGDTFRRFVHVTAIGLLVLFPADLLNTWAQGIGLGRLSLMIMALELLGGAALLTYALRRKPKRKRRLAQEESA